MSPRSGPSRGRRTRRCAVLLVAATTVALGLTAGPTAPPAAAGLPDLQQVVDDEVMQASEQGVEQSVAVVDRATGAMVASAGGRDQYISESIVKLFTVAYYEVQNAGHPDPALSARLRTMIVESDDAIQSALWSTAIVPAMAARYGLSDTENGPRTDSQDWGWELITADDEATFLYRMANDPLVAPLLMDAMAHVQPVGADGFDQDFGLNALPGDHGSKQGWTDIGAGPPLQIHSVGWTDRYFVAILQTSDTADDDALRDQSTATATAILAAESGLSPGFLRLRAGVVDVAWSLVDAVTGTATGR